MALWLSPLFAKDSTTQHKHIRKGEHSWGYCADTTNILTISAVDDTHLSDPAQ